jgi:hypothetical protein
MLWEAMAPGACSVTSSTSATGACAVVYTDEGHGDGFHILEADTVNNLDGRQISAEEAGRDAHFRADLDYAARHRLLEDWPHRIAFKAAHSKQNPEKEWGEDGLRAKHAARSLAKEGTFYRRQTRAPRHGPPAEWPLGQLLVHQTDLPPQPMSRNERTRRQRLPEDSF